ncbi:hypothetical protein CA606_20315 [Caulobacter vibrioides]|uniref:Uncharacterized protein n=1 Tax=Caulobacter vibrioides TaxID=155892 RepID=A0A2S1B7N4_CAUVI|nr:hypothetical protein CA606_20315 [Caulobacter vibrioides]
MGGRLETVHAPRRTVGKSSPQRGRRPKAGGGSAAEPASSPSVGFADTSPAGGRIWSATHPSRTAARSDSGPSLAKPS